MGLLTAPKHYTPRHKGKTYPREDLIYANKAEQGMLRRMTDGKSNMTKHGILSFVPMSSSGVSNATASMKSTGSAIGSASGSKTSTSGGGKMGSSSSQSGAGGPSGTGGASTGGGNTGTGGGTQNASREAQGNVNGTPSNGPSGGGSTTQVRSGDGKMGSGSSQSGMGFNAPAATRGLLGMGGPRGSFTAPAAGGGYNPNGFQGSQAGNAYGGYSNAANAAYQGSLPGIRGTVNPMSPQGGAVTDPYGGMGKMGLQSGQTDPYSNASAPQSVTDPWGGMGKMGLLSGQSDPYGPKAVTDAYGGMGKMGLQSGQTDPYGPKEFQSNLGYAPGKDQSRLPQDNSAFASTFPARPEAKDWSQPQTAAGYQDPQALKARALAVSRGPGLSDPSGYQKAITAVSAYPETPSGTLDPEFNRQLNSAALSRESLFNLNGGTPEQNALVSRIGPDALLAAGRYGLDARTLMGQALTESTTRKNPTNVSRLARDANNLFGIKAVGKPNAFWNGATLNMPTKEVVNGKTVSVNAPFRSYGTPEESVYDYARLMGTPRYAKALEGKTSVPDQLGAIRSAGYATHNPSDYVNMAMGNVNNLQVGGGAPASTQPTQVASNDIPASATIGDTYGGGISPSALPSLANMAISGAQALSNFSVPNIMGSLNEAAGYVKQYADAQSGFGSTITGTIADRIVVREASKAIANAEQAIAGWQQGTLTKVAAVEALQKAQKATVQVAENDSSMWQQTTPAQKVNYSPGVEKAADKIMEVMSYTPGGRAINGIVKGIDYLSGGPAYRDAVSNGMPNDNRTDRMPSSNGYSPRSGPGGDYRTGDGQSSNTPPPGTPGSPPPGTPGTPAVNPVMAWMYPQYQSQGYGLPAGIGGYY